MVTTTEVIYAGDGRRLVGRLALPDGVGPHPAVLIAHEGPGLDPIQLARADRLAELGYAAFALDYHGDLAPFTDREAMRARLADLSADPERLAAIGQAGLDVLLAETSVHPDRLAAIGHCYGGTLVLELARGGAPLRAVVGFHPGLRTTRPEAAAAIDGSVLICVGSEDPLVPIEDRTAFEREMREGAVDWQMHVYGGVGHSFSHPLADQAGIPDLAYDRTADRRSWQAMLDLFDQVLGPR